MNLLTSIRRPQLYLAAGALSLFLLGANLAIDIFAIPINFRLPEHTGEAAAAYGLRLFTSFFEAETWFLNIIVLCYLLGPKGARLSKGDLLRYFCTFALIFYLVYQRRFLLPEFVSMVGAGDPTSLHGKMANFEKFKVLVLLVSSFAGYFGSVSYRHLCSTSPQK